MKKKSCVNEHRSSSAKWQIEYAEGKKEISSFRTTRPYERLRDFIHSKWWTKTVVFRQIVEDEFRFAGVEFSRINDVIGPHQNNPGSMMLGGTIIPRGIPNDPCLLRRELLSVKLEGPLPRHGDQVLPKSCVTAISTKLELIPESMVCKLKLRRFFNVPR